MSPQDPLTQVKLRPPPLPRTPRVLAGRCGLPGQMGGSEGGGSPGPAQSQARVRRTVLRREQQSSKGLWWGPQPSEGDRRVASPNSIYFWGLIGKETFFFSSGDNSVPHSILASRAGRRPYQPAPALYQGSSLPLAQTGASDSRRGPRAPRGLIPWNGRKEGSAFRRPRPNQFLRLPLREQQKEVTAFLTGRSL